MLKAPYANILRTVLIVDLLKSIIACYLSSNVRRLALNGGDENRRYTFSSARVSV